MCLPAELQAAIADDTENEDLKALRLTCRSVSRCVFETFATRFFAKRKHLFSAYGLQTLLDITAEPSIVKYITDIHIVNLPPLYKTLESIQRRTHPKPDPSVVYAFHAIELEQSRLTEGGDAVELLREIFCNLKAAGCKLKVTASWHSSDGSGVFGAATMLRKLGLTNTAPAFGSRAADTFVPCLLESLCRSEVEIDALRMGNHLLDLSMTPLPLRKGRWLREIGEVATSSDENVGGASFTLGAAQLENKKARFGTH